MATVPAAIVAFGLTLGLAPAVLWLLRRHQVLDLPNERSSHQVPTVRGGGLAVMVGSAIALLLCSRVDATMRAGVLVVAVAMGLIGLVDDLGGLPAFGRLAAQVVVAASSLPWLAATFRGPVGWHVAFSVGVVLWIVGYVNVFNFMDGINGISVAQVVVAGSTWWVIGGQEHVGSLATGGLVLAAGGLAFLPCNVGLPFNLGPARMFLGDVGSYFLGGWLAAVAVGGVRSGLAPEAVLAPLAVYLGDTVTTLVWRLLRHQTWHQAHREHAYQRLVQRGWTHARTSLLAAGAMVACAALGALSLAGSLVARVLGDASVVAVVAAYLVSPQLAGRRAKTGRGGGSISG